MKNALVKSRFEKSSVQVEPGGIMTNQYVILKHSSPNLCKWNYLYGNLPFYKIQVNHFMARDESSGAKIIPKFILWVRGLVP